MTLFLLIKRLYKGSHLYGEEFGLMKTADGSTLSLRATIVKAAAAYAVQKPTVNVDGEKLFSLAKTGELLAQKLLNDTYDYVASGLYNIQVAFDFDAIIIGGGVSVRQGFSTELASRLGKLLAENQVAEIMLVVKPCQFHNDANLNSAAYILNLKIEELNGNN